MKLYVHYSSGPIQRKLNQLSRTLTHLQPALRDIGDLVKEETRLNFIRQSDPQGIAWRPLAQSTINARRRKRRRSRNEQILRDTGNLMNSITRNAYPNMVEVGTPFKYGQRHQFGIGVPRREFLGMNDRIMVGIVEIIDDHITKSLEGR